MNSSTGCSFTSASRPWSNAGVATFCSAGILRVASTRSLSGPSRRTSVRRSRIVGREAATSGRSSRRNGASSLRRRLGLGDEHVEVVERRAQVDERRVRAPQRRRQQTERARERDVLVRRSRAAVAFVLPTRSARSSRFSASAVTRREESTRKRVRLSSSSVTSPTSRRDVDRNGLKYFAASPASPPLPRNWRGEALDDVLEVAARLRVERVEELVEVDDGRRRGGRQRRARPRAPWRSLRPGVSAM